MSLVLPRIPEIDRGAVEAARARQKSLTKPPGSLGRLEELAIWYAGARGRFPVPVPEHVELFVFAADHGVTAEGVSAYPTSVTAAMVQNFRAGGAAINVLAREARIGLTVVDVGIAGDGSEGPPAIASPGVALGAKYVAARVRPGTANLRREPAMSRAEAVTALEVGFAMAEAAAGRATDLLVAGDMGIGNTTAASALVCAFGGNDPADVVGRGTGIDDTALARKIEVVRDALRLHRPNSGDPIGALAAVGGLEMAALTGLFLGGAARRIPVVVDGFIASAAALAAMRLAPAVRPYLLLSHMSAEPGARRACELLGPPAPLLDLGMRLGEGTGAALAVPLLRAAVAAQNQMATFERAGVAQKLPA